MLTSSFIFVIVSLVLTVVLTLSAISIFRKFGILDLPDARKVHREPVPTMGGFVLYAVFQVGLLLAWVFGTLAEHISFTDVMILEAAALIILLVGLLDDLIGLNAWKKLVPQSVAAYLVATSQMRIELITHPFGLPIAIPEPLGILITILWILGIVNAINVMDGIDGLVGTFSTIYFGTLIVLGFIFQQPLTIQLSAVMAGICLGYTFFNFPPAKIFMGNVGSNFIGFIIALMPLLENSKAGAMFHLVPIIVLLFYPIFDLGLSFFRRLIQGKNPFRGDLKHIYHYLYFLQQKGGSYLFLFIAIFLVNSATSIVASLFTREIRLAILVFHTIANLAVFTLIYVRFRKRFRQTLLENGLLQGKDLQEFNGSPADEKMWDLYIEVSNNPSRHRGVK